MKLLMLGGTVFLGRHLVELAVSRGHDVTLFTRGLHHPELFPAARKLRGDRDGGLEALRGGRWDAVIDTSGYVPRLVRDSAALLADAAAQYVFVSSIAVYADQWQPGVDEDAAVGTLPDETVEEKTGRTYGPLKALCERAIPRALPGRALIIRPGLIVGPHDPTDRFTYWPARVARGGEVLAPGRPERQVQLIDVRDLAQWMLQMVEGGRTGTYNAVGPAEVLTMQELLHTCRMVTESQAGFTWVSEEFLQEEGAVPYTEIPLWMPGRGDAVNCTRAVCAGLTFRPLEDTIRDTLAWDAARPAAVERIRGLKPAREQALLARWKASRHAMREIGTR